MMYLENIFSIVYFIFCVCFFSIVKNIQPISTLTKVWSFYHLWKATTTLSINLSISLSNSLAKKNSVWAEWHSHSQRGQTEPSETSQWRILPCWALIIHVPLHSTLPSQFHHFLLLCPSSILNKHSGGVANCDHTLECVHWVCACIGIAMQWVTLQKPLLTFLVPACKMPFSLC